MTIVIAVGFISILASLGFALFFLMKKPSITHDTTSDATVESAAITSHHAQQRTAWALTLRIALSVFLFGLILLSYYMGWIEPRGL